MNIEMTDNGNWGVPSESRRARLLLYLAEGMILGAIIPFFFLTLFGQFFVDIETGELQFDPVISGATVFVLFVVLFLLLRGIAIFREASKYSRGDTPEYQDWKESRRWIWVIALAVPIGGLLLGVSVLLWSWWEIVYLHGAFHLLSGTMIAGFLSRMYIFHLIEVEVPTSHTE